MVRVLLERHSQGVFLLTSSSSNLQYTADIVRHMPAVSAGGKSECGQRNSHISGITLRSIFFAAMQPSYRTAV